MKHHCLSLNPVVNLTIITLLLASPTIQAEEMMPTYSANMQKMMIKMNEMQTCLSAIDSEAFNQAEQAMTQAYTDVTALCQKQKPGLAQQRAVLFSKLMQQSETLNQIERCNQPMHGLLPTIPLMQQTSEILSNQNICVLMAKP